MARAPSRLSTRMAANDVTGLTDSLRGGLHIEHVGWQSGAGSLSQSLYAQSNTLAFERTDLRETRERERENEKEIARERVDARTLTDYYMSNMDLKGGLHNGATNAQPPPSCRAANPLQANCIHGPFNIGRGSSHWLIYA